MSAAGLISHVRVLDLTQRLAGPYATQMLGDLGADIIKLEPPGGDPTHRTPPHMVAGESTYYLSINRNKRSIIVDLKRPQGQEVVRRLLKSCDVLVENNRPGVMARFGLSYDDLKQQFPALVYCSISGFGQDGPDRDRGALDPTVQAMSGGMSLTGEVGGKSVRAGVPIGDICAGMVASSGILAALLRRSVSGQGDYVDISMLDVQVAMLTYQGAAYLQSGTSPGLQGRTHDSYALSYCVAARDADVMIAANQPRAFDALMRLIGRADTLADPCFATADLRNRNKTALRAILDEACKTVSAADIVKCLHGVGAPAATINTVEGAFAEPQVLHRGMLLELRGERPEEVARVPGNPIKVREASAKADCYPPHAGEHTRIVLKDLAGYDDAIIDRLVELGAVAEKPVPENAAEF
jgi:crotonobetainyl-CoA:carnitine CoA-transferase CaiB-like acyl-CoA transferase